MKKFHFTGKKNYNKATLIIHMQRNVLAKEMYPKSHGFLGR